jgi:hypothetical protein
MITRIVAGLTASLLGLAPVMSYAGTGWTNLDVIAQFATEPAFVDASGVYLNMTNTTTNPSGCSAANGFYFAIVDDRTKRMFASLTAAQLAGKPVELWVTGTCGMWGYAQIDGVVVQS